MSEQSPVQVGLHLPQEIYLWAEWQATKNNVLLEQILADMVAAQYAKQTEPAT